jgi:hypothetical protein
MELVRSLARRPSGAFYNFNVAGIVDMLGDVPEVAHIDPAVGLGLPSGTRSTTEHEGLNRGRPMSPASEPS